MALHVHAQEWLSHISKISRKILTTMNKKAATTNIYVTRYVTLPLRAKEYISHDPRDATFGALPYTKTAGPDASLALPSYIADHLTSTLEQALYSAHAHRHTQPSSHILILPNWQHSPYLARNLHSTYSQKLTSIPNLPTHNTKKNTSTTQNSTSASSPMKRHSDF
jgi:hypothetical protein